MKTNYADFYARLTQNWRTSPRKLALLRFFNNNITRLMYLLYPLMLLVIFWKNGRAVLPYVLIPGVSFVLVSVVRKLINQPRPYEVWKIEPLIIKDSKGESMPSRHVFSSTVISMCLLHLNVWLGLLGLILSLILAICRVLGGMHYPKDVLAGLLVGVACGALLFIV